MRYSLTVNELPSGRSWQLATHSASSRLGPRRAWRYVRATPSQPKPTPTVGESLGRPRRAPARQAAPTNALLLVLDLDVGAEAGAEELGVGEEARRGAGADRGRQVVAVGTGGAQRHPVGAGEAAVEGDVGLQLGDRGLERRALDPVADGRVLAELLEAGERLVDELVEVELRVAVDPERRLAEAVVGARREAGALRGLGPAPVVGQRDREAALLDELRLADRGGRLDGCQRRLAGRAASESSEPPPRRAGRSRRRTAATQRPGDRQAEARVAEAIEEVGAAAARGPRSRM